MDLSFDLKLPLTQMNWNDVSWGSYFGKELKRRLKAARISLNTACLAGLEANKNQQQVEPNLMSGFFTDSTTDEFDTAQAEKSDQWVNKREQLDVMNFEGRKPYRNIGNSIDYTRNVWPAFNDGAGRARHSLRPR